jgi:hypothetical protein
LKTGHAGSKLGVEEFPETVLQPDVESSDLMVTRHHYDHTDADRDINVVFPIDILRELKADGKHR